MYTFTTCVNADQSLVERRGNTLNVQCTSQETSTSLTNPTGCCAAWRWISMTTCVKISLTGKFKELHGFDDEIMDADDSDEALWQGYLDAQNKTGDMFAKPVDEHPEWKWVMMKDTHYKLDLLRRRSTYCDPYRFPSMHFYGHYHGYGVTSLLESEVSCSIVVVLSLCDLTTQA